MKPYSHGHLLSSLGASNTKHKLTDLNLMWSKWKKRPWRAIKECYLFLVLGPTEGYMKDQDGFYFIPATSYSPVSMPCLASAPAFPRFHSCLFCLPEPCTWRCWLKATALLRTLPEGRGLKLRSRAGTATGRPARSPPALLGADAAPQPSSGHICQQIFPENPIFK